MGQILQQARVQNSADVFSLRTGGMGIAQVRQLDLEFLVDTGAAMLCLPIESIEQLGLVEMQQQRVITANGEVFRRIFSPVRIEVQDRETELGVMELPNDTPPLLGSLPLGALDLYPNLQKQILEGNPKYDGKMVINLL